MRKIDWGTALLDITIVICASITGKWQLLILLLFTGSCLYEEYD